MTWNPCVGDSIAERTAIWRVDTIEKDSQFWLGFFVFKISIKNLGVVNGLLSICATWTLRKRSVRICLVLPSYIYIFCKVLLTGPISHVVGKTTGKSQLISFTRWWIYLYIANFYFHNLWPKRHPKSKPKNVSVNVKHTATLFMHENIIMLNS